MAAQAWRRLLVAIGGAIIPNAPTQAINALLDALLAIESEEVILLRAIDQKIHILLEGPYRSGWLALTDALQESDPQMRDILLEDARRFFMQAEGQTRETERQAFCELLIAMCLIARGKKGSAFGPLRRARLRAYKVKLELWRNAPADNAWNNRLRLDFETKYFSVAQWLVTIEAIEAQIGSFEPLPFERILLQSTQVLDAAYGMMDSIRMQTIFSEDDYRTMRAISTRQRRSFERFEDKIQRQLQGVFGGISLPQ